MPINKLSRYKLAGTSLSPSHVPEFMDLIDEMIDQINTNEGVSPNSRIVIVNDVSDFPTAIGGARTLADFTLYYVQAPIDIGDSYLQMGTGSSVVGISPGPCSITNEHAQYLIKGNGGIRNIQLIATAGTAVFADGGGTSFLANVVITGSSRVFEGTDVGRLTIDRLFLGGNTDGILLSGDIDSGIISGVQASPPGDSGYVGIEIGDAATIGPLIIKDCQWSLNQNGQSVFDFSPSATYNEEVFIQDNNLVMANGATPLASGSADQTDPEFEFFHNTGIPDSAYVGSIGLDGNTTEQTTITTQDVFVNVGTGNASHPVYSLLDVSERFDLTGSLPDQDLRYIGVEDITVLLVCSVTGERVGGGTDIIRTRVTKNGTAVEGTEGSAESSSASSSITRAAPVSLSNGDLLRVQLANGTDTSNIIARSVRLTATRV